MSTPGLDSIEIFDDKISDEQILKLIADGKDNEDPFRIVNVGDIFCKHQKWLEKMPRIHPFYGKLIVIYSFRYYYLKNPRIY